MVDFGLPLGRLYGPAWINDTLWDAGFRSIWKPKVDKSNHNCSEPGCGGAIKTSCYDDLHFAFCICLVTMPNGHQRFCGQRFQVDSSKICAKHGWGENDENRIFQRAKNSQDFELPGFIPHEQPGWEMKLRSLGPWKSPVIRMGLIHGEHCFVRVISYDTEGNPDQVSPIARVKPWELLLTEPLVGQP
ncbi:hypothetical protein G6514_007505 [Epicoccum nigrum]|nr:hypothetical protein G6514_007505 [Epicoccum nigrum]